MKKLVFLWCCLYSFLVFAFEGPHYCGESKSPVFKNKEPNDIFRFDLMTDFSDINVNKYQEHPRPGILAYIKNNGERVSIPVQITPRGNSRRSYCAAVPLKVEFDQEHILKNIVGDPNTVTIQEEYHAYAQFSADMPDVYNAEYKGSKQYDNVFKKIGKKIKLVTHCGRLKNGDQWILGADTDAEQTLRLLQEHYLYALLGTLETTTLKTRLSLINYLNKKGNVIGKRVGLIRETDRALGKRCGLSHEPILDENGSPINVDIDQGSSIQTNILNSLFYQSDYRVIGHNTFALYDENAKYSVPYDYDLSGIIQPDYSKNNGHHSEQIIHVEKDLERLGESHPEITQKILSHILDREDEMNEILENMVISTKSKIGFKAIEDMYEWFDNYMQVAADQLAKLEDK
jgi:hypothetical protein